MFWNIPDASEVTNFTTRGALFHDEDVIFSCFVSSRPPSDIVLSGPTKELDGETGSSLEWTFETISILDSGKYECSAMNSISATPDVAEIDVDILGNMCIYYAVFISFNISI